MSGNPSTFVRPLSLSLKRGDSLFIAFGENWSTVILKDNGAYKWEYHEDLGFSMPSMQVNGVFMKDNPALFRFIDRYVYGPHSNDYWFIDTTREIIRLVRNLNVTKG